MSVWGYYVVTLVPVLGIVQVGGQAMADRYTYLPGIGPFFVAGLFAAWSWEKLNIMKKWSRAFKSAVAVAALYSCICFGSIFNCQANRHMENQH